MVTKIMLMVSTKPKLGMVAKNLTAPVWSVVAQRARPTVALDAYLLAYLAVETACLTAVPVVR